MTARTLLSLALLTAAAAAGETAPPDFSRSVRNCATCHAAQAKPHPSSEMAHGTENVAECGILRDHPLLTLKANGYSYKIERKGDQSLYSVTDGKDTLTVPIGWSFGLGAAGQTYVYAKDGKYYESFVSYYAKIGALDITMGDQAQRPRNLTEALGREMGQRETLLCFSCHNTDSVAGDKLTLNSLVPGVQCERCHGPAQDHLVALKSGDTSKFAMKKLGALNAEEMNQFCGQCHRTWEQIATNGPRGLLNVRFQPYRLTNSRCFDVDDKRISCVACHDPHKEVDRVTANYDVYCQACHAGGKPGAKTCTTGAKDCASCHMPKLELPGSHHRFADHNIRIVRAGSQYPD